VNTVNFVGVRFLLIHSTEVMVRINTASWFSRLRQCATPNDFIFWRGSRIFSILIFRFFEISFDSQALIFPEVIVKQTRDRFMPVG